jgi:hypothetical protein
MHFMGMSFPVSPSIKFTARRTPTFQQSTYQYLMKIGVDPTQRMIVVKH